MNIFDKKYVNIIYNSNISHIIFNNEIYYMRKYCQIFQNDEVIIYHDLNNDINVYDNNYRSLQFRREKNIKLIKDYWNMKKYLIFK